MELKKRKLSTCFKKGIIPWNKGKVGVMPTPWNKGKILIDISKKLKCIQCGKEYGYKKNSNNKWVLNKKFCSEKCHSEWQSKIPTIKKCNRCGKEFKSSKSSQRKFCSKKCYYERMKEAYKYLNNITVSYKQISINGNKRDENRRIIEKFIGRKLKRTEIIHHKNGIKNDNSIENLQIVTRKEHNDIHFIKNF